jgi:hypothetical protein
MRVLKQKSEMVKAKLLCYWKSNAESPKHSMLVET